MDLEQVLKRVQWIDDERRKDKDAIALLENRILALEGSLSAADKLIKEQSGEITRLSAITTRMDQHDEALLQQRVENKHALEELDKTLLKRSEEVAKVHQLKINTLETDLFEVRKGLDPISKLEKGIQNRVEEDNRLGRLIDDLRGKIDDVRRSEDEYTRTYRLLEDGRRQDTKRINDLVGEVTALRKRTDDQRGQVELVNASMRKLDARLSELLTVETERRDAQAAFLDKQAILQVERDRTWKEWQTRFDLIEKQAGEVTGQLQTLETTHRDVRRSQQVLEDLNQRVERRIGEITEIQRLSEDRFRQEWVTFKADDQKRWTNYTLNQEETKNEATRQTEKVSERVTLLEDEIQESQDQLQVIAEQTEKRLQSLLALAHEWVAAYERSIGRSR